MNLFTIDSIEYNENENKNDWLRGEFVHIRIKFEIKGRIEFRCDEHGSLLFCLRIITEGTANEHYEALKLAVMGFFDQKRYYCRTQHEYHPARCRCRIDHKNIAADFSNLEEPYKELFQQFFDKNKWNSTFDLPVSV